MEILRLRIEKNGRGGKMVTIIEGFSRRSEEISELSSRIKSALGTGGTAKNACIEIQGNFQKQVSIMLQELGFQVRGS